ncbi:MAG: TetR/AcrR family transcriptional regulator [Candidatus Methanomethylophilaceae archaeon]|nr:TetR/AcrR family transcriptional regulator [Candidatus Methanomethylophilaceae archaeon]
MKEGSPITGRKADITEAALSLFLEKGYQRTRIDDIIERVGIAKGTFYHHFQSKIDVLEAVVLNLISHYLGLIEEISERDCSAAEKLTLIWNSLGDIGDGSHVLEEIMEDDENFIFLWTLIRKGLDASLPLHLQVIGQGLSEGSINTPYPEMAAKTFAAFDVLIFSACSEEERNALAHFVEKILETDRPYLTGTAKQDHNEVRI